VIRVVPCDVNDADIDKRIQTDQADINWEFIDNKELSKQGECYSKLLTLCLCLLHWSHNFTNVLL